MHLQKESGKKADLSLGCLKFKLKELLYPRSYFWKKYYNHILNGKKRTMVKMNYFVYTTV